MSPDRCAEVDDAHTRSHRSSHLDNKGDRYQYNRLLVSGQTQLSGALTASAAATVSGTLGVTGNVTAPNLVYSVTASGNLASSDGQTPALSITDGPTCAGTVTSGALVAGNASTAGTGLVVQTTALGWPCLASSLAVLPATPCWRWALPRQVPMTACGSCR